MIKKANRIDSQVAMDQAELTTAAFIDEIAAATEHGGYLVGSRFSVADLTAAA